jgi:LPXTG-motif cell wall-anchored protein
MNRDTVKTLAGLLVIGMIVVATFLYGNAQRQSQLKHDQNVKNQQASTLKPGTASPSSSATSSPAPSSPKATTSNNPSTNTAPVQSVTSNTLQGSKPKTAGKPSPTSTPKPSPSGQVAGAATTPTTGGTGSSLPQTGSPALGGLGLAAIAVMWLGFRRSKRALLMAVRGNRSSG